MRADPLLDPGTLDQFLRAHRLPPLERFGQHFLIDPAVLDRIVRAAAPDPAIPLVEIGAGLGVLTRALTRAREEGRGKRDEEPAPLFAVELDRRLIHLLRERVQELPNVHVIHGDILKLSASSLIPRSSFLIPRSYDIVGNIPYNITAKLLRHLLAWSPRPRRMTLLLDASVAARIAASPPDMSVLAVSVQVYAEPRIVPPPIPPSAFFPPPQVTSAVTHLKIRGEPLVSSDEAGAFFRLVRAGFSQKRKTLANALAATYRVPPQDMARCLLEAGIEPTRRAQTLTIQEWYTLLKHIHEKPALE